MNQFFKLAKILEVGMTLSIMEIQSEGFKGNNPKLKILYIINVNVIAWKKQYTILYPKIEYS
jgi:hypothetical protein